MKILLIHQYFNVLKGGFRTYAFSKYLVSKGHEVVVITSNRDNNEWGKIHKTKIDGINILYIKNSYHNRMSFFRRIISFLRFMYLSIKEALKIKDADLIYATSTPVTVGITGMIYKRIRKKPFVFEVRDLWPDLPIAMGIIKNSIIIRILKYFEKRIYYASDKIIVLSPGMKEGVVKTGYPEHKIELIPNGCDIDILNSQNNENFIIPETKSSDLVLIYAGNFGLANGLDYVIDFAKYLKERNVTDIKFVLIGDGMKREELNKSIKELELNNILMFDYMPKASLIKYIKSADMGLQLLADIPAFYYGTSPNKFFDYIALSKPVFNNYPGWLAEMIIENNCGCVVDRYNFEEALEKLKFYKTNKNELKIQGNNAYNLALKKFDRTQLASNLEELFKKTLI